MTNSIGMKIASLTFAIILLGMTVTLAVAQDAEASRRVIDGKIKDTKNNGVAVVCIGKILDADVTQSFTATIQILANDVVVGTGEGIVDPNEPVLTKKNAGVDQFKMSIDNSKNIAVAKYKLFNLDETQEYVCSIRITQTGPDPFITRGLITLNYV